MDPADFPSKSRINKAGRYLREYVAGRLADPDPAKVEEYIEVVTAFREAHGYPMTKVRNGLDSMVSTEGLNAAVTQRHKRVPRIVRKLVRMEGTGLARLEDIGGCRVVVQNIADMDTICRRIRKNWSSDFTREPRDYVSYPKDIGYRARHFVVIRDDRAIEVQVRTVGQQRWADAVEAIDGRLRLRLKDGIGPEALLEYFSLAGEVIWMQEADLPIPPMLQTRFMRSRKRVVDEGFYSG